MSALAAYKDTPPNMTYIWNKKKLYADAIKKLNRSDSLLVVPINSIDKMDATKTTPSLVYLCSVDSIFIFDLIALKENGITKEMSDIIKSNKIKFVFSKPITFNRLGIDNWHNIPNVLDFEASGEKFSPFDDDGNQEEAGASAPSTEFRIADVDWSVRPFKSDEHFKAGKRIYQLLIVNSYGPKTE